MTLPPRIACYNLNWMSLCTKEKRDAKLHLLRDILHRHSIVGISELHGTSTAEADLYFFNHLKCERYYDSSVNLVILVDPAFVEEHKPIRHHIIHSGAIHAISFSWDGHTSFFYNIYLDASSDSSIKVQQLESVTTWTARNVARGDNCFFGGDRNHTRDPSESMAYHGVSGDAATVRAWAARRPQFSVIEAWDKWMAAMHGGYIVDQPEFTFKRKRTNGDGYFCSVLDVMGSNLNAEVYGCEPSCELLPTPDSEATDHSPLGLRWIPHRAQRRGGRRRESGVVRRPLPAWLLGDQAFCLQLDREVQSWLRNRSMGGEGLLEFVNLCYAVAASFLRGNLVEAVTTQHKLSITLHLLRELQATGSPGPEVRVSFDLLQRVFRIYPGMKSVVEVTVDTHGCRVHTQPIKKHASELLALLGESATLTAEDTGSFLTQRWHSNLFKELKEALPKTHCPELQELVDPDSGQTTADPEDMVRIIKAAAYQRQGVDPSDNTAGASLLSDWGIDLSECRTLLRDVEVEAIILGAPAGKKPGPDGVPAEFFKVYAAELSVLFQEAWVELMEGRFPACTELGQRKWIVAPKAPGVTSTDKLRDLEMCNTTRKTLSRMCNKVLDEVFKKQLCPAQQAFFSDGDISRNLVKMHTLFRDAQYRQQPPAGFAYSAEHRPAGGGGAPQALADLLIILSLDCSKGYNRLGWNWIKRCLRASQLPGQLITLIEQFLPGTVHLIFWGEQAGLSLESGLAQGDPLSCFIFILCVDPLLCKLQSLPDVAGVAGFVDDWNAICRGVQALRESREVVLDFEQASGQQINVGKSGLIPSRYLTPCEVIFLQTIWHGINIYYNTRVLGLQIGIEASIEDQYTRPLAKFTERLAEFSAMRRQLSTSMRVAVVNVFLYSLFSFVNRFFYMPARILSHAQNAAREFIMPIPFATIHIFSHLKRLYGIAGELRDLRHSNVAAVLATYILEPANTHHLTQSLEFIAQQRQDSKITGPLVHPAHSWIAARAYFYRGSHTEPETFYKCTLPTPERLAKLDLILLSKQKVLYRGLQESDLLQCKQYLLSRVQVLDNVAFLDGLEHALTLKTNQGQRWHLFKIQFNGHVTSQRRHDADPRREPAVAACFLCGSALDSVEHLFVCPPVVEALHALGASGFQGPFTHSDFFFCPPMAGQQFELRLALFAAVWSARGAMVFGRRGAVNSRARLSELIHRGVAEPWLLGTPSQTRQERRAARVRSPSPAAGDVGQYSGDGARAQGGNDELATGWGALYWDPGQDVDGPPTASSSGILEEPATSNMAELEAMLQILTRAAHQRCQKVVISMDSLLVVNYMNGVWACHRQHLLDNFQKCRDLITCLKDSGCDVTIRHIYREYNKPADALAGRVIQAPHTAGPSDGW